jgi:hypothetical protein
MKGKRHGKAGGGLSGDTGGDNEAEKDVKDKPEARTNAKSIDDEAEEMKKGGRAKKRRRGGPVKVEGEKAKMHAGRKPRASGGSTSDKSPFTSARKGSAPSGAKLQMESEG